MWWFNSKRKDELKDSIARTQMEIALSGTNKYREGLEKMKMEQLDLDMKHAADKAQQKLLSNMVPSLDRLDALAEGEYEKWLLDETGMYVPKLKNK